MGSSTDQREKPHPSAQSGGGARQGQRGANEGWLSQSSRQPEDGLAGSGRRPPGGNEYEGRHRDPGGEQRQEDEEQGVTASENQGTSAHRPGHVAEALGRPVPAKGAAPALLSPEGGDHRPCRGGEGGGRCPLGQSGQAERIRIAGQHERGRGQGESNQAPNKHRAGADSRPPYIPGK